MYLTTFIPTLFSLLIISHLNIFKKIFKKDFICLLLERGEGGRKKGRETCEKYNHMAPAGDLAHNPGMCPDWDSNRRSFGSQASAQFTESHLPGLI